MVNPLCNALDLGTILSELTNQIANLIEVPQSLRFPPQDREIAGYGNEIEYRPVNSMWITGTITAKQKVRGKVPGLYAVTR